MRTHTKTFHIRLTEKEYERLCRQAEKSGLPKTTYIRHMINGNSPSEKPPDMFWAILKELHYIGNNLNQLTRMAHQVGNLHSGKLDKAIEEHTRLYLSFFKQVILPEKVDVPATLDRGRNLAELEQNEKEQTNAR